MKKGILILVIGLLLPSIAGATNIDTSNKYTYGENIGWVDFGLDIGNVTVSDSKLSGYAYGENIGWVSLNCENTNTCNSINYGVLNDGNGDLSGYAYGENIGWVDFNNVSISSTDGIFSGYAYSPNIGYISFNCSNTNTCSNIDFKLKTSWIKTVAPVVIEQSSSGRRSGGGGGGSSKKKVVASTTTPVGDVLGATFSFEPNTNQPTESLSDKNRISNINTDLFLGMTGPNIKKLQQLLNKLGYKIAEAGPGSIGNETEYFGNLTKNALAKFQADNNIYPAAGYFGPKTKALLALKGF